LRKLKARLQGRAELSQVTEQLAIGSAPRLRLLREVGIEAVVDLRREAAPLEAEAEKLGLEYYRLPVRDRSAPPVEELLQVVEWVRGRIRAGRRVSVHCHLGRGRSALVVAAYLVAEGMGVEEAVEHLRARRPFIHLNRAQREALSRFAEALGERGHLQVEGGEEAAGEEADAGEGDAGHH
jgi:protein-tyrosine phosphatase